MHTRKCFRIEIEYFFSFFKAVVDPVGFKGDSLDPPPVFEYPNYFIYMGYDKISKANPHPL